MNETPQQEPKNQENPYLEEFNKVIGEALVDKEPVLLRLIFMEAEKIQTEEEFKNMSETDIQNTLVEVAQQCVSDAELCKEIIDKYKNIPRSN